MKKFLTYNSSFHHSAKWFHSSLILLVFLLTGCHYGEALQEEQDLENGKIFSIEQGCVQYSEGIQFYFAEYGKKQCIEVTSYLLHSIDSTLPPMNVSYIYRDSMLYMACEELGYYYTLGPEDIFDIMAVRVEEFRLFGTYEISSTKLKPLGDLQVVLLTDRSSKHSVTSYGRVRMTETNYSTTLFDDRYEAIMHNINVQHFYPTITQVTNKDPFDLSKLEPFEIWNVSEEEWSSEMKLMYFLYLFFTYDDYDY